MDGSGMTMQATRMDGGRPDVPEQAARQAWIRLLGQMPVADLEMAWADLPEPPEYSLLKPAEAGLVMVRGRAGGNGQVFHLGEMTVTRCVVRLRQGRTGVSYVPGRSRRHGELAAVFDAMLQTDTPAAAALRSRLNQFEQRRRSALVQREGKVAGTRVNFFTLVRGED